MNTLVESLSMELTDGRYQLQGVDVLDIVRQFGSPLYVYDASKISYQYHQMMEAFQGLNAKIKYPVKALSNLSILKLFNKLGSGLDTVSIHEVKLALKAGFDPKDIIFTPNCVAFPEIQQAIKLGVQVTLDNISILEQFGHTYGDKIPCSLRFNPHISAGGNTKIRTGHIDSKFGISIYQMRHVQRIIEASNIRINGLHVHTGSDILDARSYSQAANILFETAYSFKDLDFIDFGSGFKVGYKQGDISTDIFAIGKELRDSYGKFTAEYGKEVEIWFEPGKYMVSEAGFFLMQANVIKPTPATVFVGVNAGLNHFIRPMMYGGHHEIFNVSNPEGTPRIYTIVGYICETDTFGSDRKLSEVREGDILALRNAGAYGFMMSSNYNSRPRPAEVMVVNGEAKLIRERENFDDLLRGQVEIEV